MFRCLVTIAAVLLVLPAFGQSAGGSEHVTAGKVDLIEGDVRFIDAAGHERRPAYGDAVYAGETIATGADGEVHLNMEDGGYIGVRPDTRMQIVDYRAEGGSDDRSIFSLLRGSFRSITGWIGKYANQNYKIETPTVTIGVRGTDHEPKVIPEGSTDGEPGTYDKVNIGATFMNGPQGRVEVGANQAGFAPRGRTARPRVLAHVPAFYRPTRNEARFAGRNEAIRKHMDQLRDQRRKVIQERRAAAAKVSLNPGAREARPAAGFGAHPPAGTPRTSWEERRQLRQERLREYESQHAAAKAQGDPGWREHPGAEKALPEERRRVGAVRRRAE